MNIITATLAISLASSWSALPAPSPKASGAYACDGGAEHRILVSGLPAGYVTRPVRGYLRIAKNGAAGFGVTTKGWEANMVATFPPSAADFDLSGATAMGRVLKEKTRRCRITGLEQSGRVAISEQGKAVWIKAVQRYTCSGGDLEEDIYLLNCRR